MDLKWHSLVARRRLQMPLEWDSEEAIWPLFLWKSGRQEEIWRHNLGAAASQDDTAENKNKELEDEEEEEG